ncbi:MAG: hypothetical protein DRH37_01125 [Deltaproteobacteria bacterium]|nr:MAG: hypothetical protein DRH37_01125 [Deltaproteobacteria bacterium]
MLMKTDQREKVGEIMDSDHRMIEECLKAFQALGQEDVHPEPLFQKVKLIYHSMEEHEKELFFRTIIERVEVPKEEMQPYLEALIDCSPGDPKWPSLLSEVRNRFYSPRLKLLKKISYSSGGLKFLLDFRGDLLTIQRSSDLDLKPLDSDIVFLFEMWFQEGFLYLEEITLDSSYRQIERIKNSDMVHPMASIEEMGQRLGKDRRCFALYHRLLPREPIVFIEVALTKGLARNVSEIMARAGGRRGRGKVDTAVFYSINNTQNGLAGLGLGKMLVGKVVDSLKKENEKVRNFATLSPVPGFWQGYLKPILEGRDDAFSLKSGDIISFFSKKDVARILKKAGEEPENLGQFNAALVSILSDSAWAVDDDLVRILRDPMVKIAYHYIANEKNPRGKPLNPVANFHLGNGATVSVSNVNFLANPSEKGLEESCGIMVNYIYTFSWLSQIRRSFRWFDRMEVRGFFR